jgi:hypothetical protein
VGVLTVAIVGGPKRIKGLSHPDDPDDDNLWLNMGAMDSVTGEYQSWPSQMLFAGDSVTIEIEDVETMDPPSERRIYPEEQRIENVKANARRLATELGWTLIEAPPKD